MKMCTEKEIDVMLQAAESRGEKKGRDDIIRKIKKLEGLLTLKGIISKHVVDVVLKNID